MLASDRGHAFEGGKEFGAADLPGFTRIRTKNLSVLIGLDPWPPWISLHILQRGWIFQAGHGIRKGPMATPAGVWENLRNPAPSTQPHRDVKNEDCSLWLVENKGAKKVLLIVN